MGEKLNVKETTEVVSFGALLAKKALAAKEKGIKGALSELDKLIDLFPAAVAAVKGIDKVDDELKDLDDSEIEILVGAVTEHFPAIANADAVETAKDVLIIVKRGYAIFKRHKGA